MAKTDYMLGLKVGNTSVGFAAVDRNYQIVRKHGKALWGVRLFDEAQTAEKHGTTEQGCASEQKARGEAPANSIEERITNFRQRIADRQAKEGKNYLSFYYIEGDTYEIVE